MRRIAVLDAPSNLGLRPPTVTSVPGCAKAPGALRDHGLLDRLHARDAGCLTPPRYDPGDWRPGDGVCHAEQIAQYSRRLADRIGGILDAGEFPVILGGDCSIVLGSGLAMHRLGQDIGGRIGLVFVDGHSDFRHPGNASYVGAAAGEDLALVTGRGQADLAAIEGRRPYFRDVDVVVLGIRAQDEYRLDLQAAGIVTRPVPALRAEGAARSAQWARDQLVDCAGYWVHVDVDVLDPAVMPAVDAPSPGGIAFPELELLLAGLVDTPHCLGVEITVFDPDYDNDGSYAEEITSTLVAGLTPVRTVAARPDLIAARQDLAKPAAIADSAAVADSAADSPALADSPAVAEVVLEEARRDEALADDELEVLAESERDEWDAAEESEPAEESESVEERRAAAAADSVPLAASAMSDFPGMPGETAAPAATLHAVEDAGEVEAFPGEFDPAQLVDDTDESAAAEEDEPAEEPKPAPGAAEGAAERASEAREPGRPMVPRPLGSAPLLDSEPLPATRPGMLRPRAADARFSLPAQRPAFDPGPEESADIS